MGSELTSLRGRRLKGKGKGVLGARETRGAHEEGGRAPRFSLVPKTPFPFPFKRLPRRLANARPRDDSKIAFYCHLWLRPKLQQCYQILFEGDVYLKCILLARNVVFKIGWIDFFILWKKGWDK